jgi:hypothetical protein
MSRKSLIRFISFPKTAPPPHYIFAVVDAFRQHENEISTERKNGLSSNQVLKVVRPSLIAIGFDVEDGRAQAGKIERPVFFGENGVPAQQFQVDAYNEEYRCGLEVEAGRGWMSNAVYRDLVLAAVMVNVDHFCLAVSNTYRFNRSTGSKVQSRDFEKVVQLAETIYAHDRIRLPYGLTVIGY